MSKIEDRINEVVEDFALFDDELGKYEYIVDVGKELEKMDESKKQDKYLIEGCTSNIWLICEKQENKLVFFADSNTVIVKGIVAILIKIFSNLSAKEINDADFSLLDRLKLSDIITPSRQNGVTSMINKIKEYAREADHD